MLFGSRARGEAHAASGLDRVLAGAAEEEGAFPLPVDREVLLSSLEALLLRCEQALASQG